MAGRRIGVVQEAQRNPAGMKLCLDPHVAPLGAVFVADPVGSLGIPLVKHLARQQAPFRPPFVAVDDKGRIARGGK